MLPWLLAAGLAWTASAWVPMGSVVALAASASLASLGLACLAMAGGVVGPGAPAERLGLRSSGVSAAVLAGFVLGLLTLSSATDATIGLLGLSEVGHLPEIDRTVRTARGGAVWISLIGLAVFPGIGEELAFRGWLQRGLEPRLGAVGAVLLAAGAFGAIHGELIHGAGAFVLGLYLGAVTALTGSIRPAIVCHVANNAIALAVGVTGATWVAAVLVVAGLLAGPWAFRVTHLRKRAARSSLDGTPESG